jgi:Secretion system C-terminal sorting domain
MNNIIFITAVALFLGFGTMSATQRAVPGSFGTIQAAINASSTGDTIAISNGTYHEAVVVNKSVRLLGASSLVVITPPSGVGITVTANNVRLQSLRVTHATSNGIFASNVTNLSLINAGADSNNVSGAQLINVTGTSVVTNFTAVGNKIHGVSIGAGCADININGGTFIKNGTGRTDGTGAGINMNASGSSLISNISIQGPLTASNNTAAGIWANAASSTDTIKTVMIGATGVVMLTNNGGAGVIVSGNVKDATVTGNFTKGAATAAGILIVGVDSYGSSSPINTSIRRCTFNSGYLPDQPAITLSAPEVYRTSKDSVSADSNVFVGASTQTAIDNLIYDKLDDPNLGLVTRTHDNELPVELISFSALARGRQIEMRWNTATEVNNYGFEIERIPLNPPFQGGSRIRNADEEGGFQKIGFVAGNGTTSAPQAYVYRDEVQAAGKFQYRLKQIDRDGKFEYSASVEVTSALAPADYGLSQNYPNPFNPSTKIRFALEKTGLAEVKVFDTIGREVQILFSGFAYSGELQEISFMPEKLAAGVYFYTLSTNDRNEVKKMLLLK